MESWRRPEECWGVFLEDLSGVEELGGGWWEGVPVIGEGGWREVEIGSRFRGRRRRLW